MALRLFALQLPVQFPPFDGRMFGSLPERGDVVVFRHPAENADLIKRVIGLARRHDRGARRQAHPQRQAAAARAARRRRRCRSAPTARAGSSRRPRRTIAGAAMDALLPLSRLSRDPARRAELQVLDQVDDGPADDFRATQRSRRPCLPDGRQSRRQPRQPLFRRSKAASAWCRSKI